MATKTTSTKKKKPKLVLYNPETGELTVNGTPIIFKNALTGHPIKFDNTGRIEK